MGILRLPCIALSAVLAGCVVGGERCLFLEPVKVSLTGKIHFHDYPSGEGVDHVPVLALDRTAHVYAPAVSYSCLPVNDVQLVGWSEMPPDIVENAHVTVDGSLAEAATPHQHTRFLVNVGTIVSVTAPAPAAPTAPAAPAR